jgi:hypothetical protein
MKVKAVQADEYGTVRRDGETAQIGLQYGTSKLLWWVQCFDMAYLGKAQACLGGPRTTDLLPAPHLHLESNFLL